ncbi:hypothetical protein [Deinococcus gobiensis]|uniref:Uncharacterized protein n=1 Tax=Deinococcus gobiensis (strain DSM 21396 / JCM 16679 / CGMCC 1.7299 / I-0) TaxID=745776 RepID=H8H196_DEIGI|nr:hypothetical protein [Deinococcus gobiensis]AFD27293.1 hypothetical protein DGo_PB0024 [Deinococcus gobiensis I-0]
MSPRTPTPAPTPEFTLEDLTTWLHTQRPPAPRTSPILAALAELHLGDLLAQEIKCLRPGTSVLPPTLVLVPPLLL